MGDDMTAPAGWYPQPDNPGIVRWWDGGQWTDQTQFVAPQVVSPKPKRKIGLAVTAGVVTLVGAIGSTLGIVAALVLIVGIVFAILSLSKREGLKALSIVSLCIAPIALVVSLATGSAPTRATGVSEPQPIVVSEYKELAERDLAVLMKDPVAHKDERIVLYARVTQFDSATGGCTFRANAAHARMNSSWDYNHNVVFTSGSGGIPCDRLKGYVENDEIKVLARVSGLFNYKTVIGAEMSAPQFRIDQIDSLK